MPRNYIKKGIRCQYSKEDLKEALEKLRNGVLCLKKVMKKYKIPRATIKYKLKGLHHHSVGRPTVFTKVEENCFAKRINLLCEWGFPVNGADIKEMLKSCLKKVAKMISIFNNNCPEMIGYTVSWRDKILPLTLQQTSKEAGPQFPIK